MQTFRCLYQQMLNSRVSILNKTQQNQDISLDPFEAYELILQEKIFLPLTLPQQQEPKVSLLVFKIMREKNSQKLLIYLLSQSDLYFVYKIEYNMGLFRLSFEQIMDLNNQFKLSLKRVNDFVEFMKISLEDIQNQTKMGFVQIQDEQSFIFQLKKLMGGKSHLVMRLQGKKEDQEFIKHRVAYQYGSIRERIAKKQQKIQQLREMVRLKNPYLLKNFKQL